MPKKTKMTKKKADKPKIEEGSFSIVLNVEEMFSLIQILSFSKEVFEKMSENCRKDGNDKSMRVYGARSQLSLILYEKFKIIAGIGEPTSREVH